MSQTERLERDLTAWFSETASPRTPYYSDDLLARTSGMRQRPAWTLPERWLSMSAITLTRRTLAPVPWRAIGLLALLALLTIVAAAIYIGSTMQSVPAPYGVAGNGLVAVEDQGDIVLVDPVTGERTVAIGGPSLDIEPLFSRDGTQLAFLRQTDVGRDLWIAEADGTNQRQIAAGLSAEVSGAQWAPDGRSILLPDIVDGTSAITIVSTDRAGEARTLDVGMPAELPTWGIGAAWRPPDGREILFRGATPTGFGLFAVRPDGSGVRPVTASNGAKDYDALFSSWSPDGSQVAYQWREGAGDMLLYVLPAEGGTPRSISTIESVGVQWSPDGKTIAFIDEDDQGARHLQVVAADGSGRLFQGPAGLFGVVLWTPDGAKILFQSDSGSMLVDPTDGQSQPWSSGAATDWQRVALP